MKISELGLAGALSGTEVLPIVQSGTTKKVSIDDVVAHMFNTVLCNFSDLEETKVQF